jgi:hypothetical protein
MCIYDVYGPCSCPHGKCFTVMAQCFAIGSWVSSVMALTSCFYVYVRPMPEEGIPEWPREGFGWIGRQVEVLQPPAYGRQCTWYTADERAIFFDSMWNAGFAMSILTVLLGLVAMSMVMCTCCVAFQMPMFDGLFWTCAICFVAQCLTFLSWGSELCENMECTWSSGTGMNVTAAMMWLWAANMIKSFPEALPPRRRRYDDQTTVYTDDDGTGDVYLSNRSMTSRGDDFYEDNNYGGYADDNDDGYYDEDGNWIANNADYDDDGDNGEYSSYDDYNGEYDSGGYTDYDNEDSSNWAESSENDSDAHQEKEGRGKTKRRGRKKKQGLPKQSFHSSFSEDEDWNNELT